MRTSSNWVSAAQDGAGPVHDTVKSMATDPIERFEALLAAGKDGALLRFGLGTGYLKAGKRDRAVEHLRAAVELDPAYSAAWKFLGKALAECARTGEAIEAYRRGIAAAERKGDKQAAKEMNVFLRRLQRPPSD
jgi:predicted Zn-dependent protease